MSKDEIVPNVLPETGYVRIAQIIGDKKKKKKSGLLLSQCQNLLGGQDVLLVNIQPV